MSKRSLYIVALMVGMMAPVVGCEAQVPNPELQIAGAVQALPDELRDGASVLGYDTSGQLVSVREGTGDMICLADDPNQEGFRVACYHQSLEPYMARGRELRAEGMGGESIMVRHKEANEGTLAMPAEPAMVYNLWGASFDLETGTVSESGTLYAVYIPNATAESTGLPTSAVGPGVPWIMRPGTPSAHIMISGPSN